jgi:hypothetical protein
MRNHFQSFMSRLGLEKFGIQSFPHIGCVEMSPAMEYVNLRGIPAHACFYKSLPQAIEK